MKEFNKYKRIDSMILVKMSKIHNFSHYLNRGSIVEMRVVCKFGVCILKWGFAMWQSSTSIPLHKFFLGISTSAATMEMLVKSLSSSTSKSNLSIDGLTELQGASTVYQDTTQNTGESASANYQDNVLDLLERSMYNTQAATQAALAQGEELRRESKSLALIIKDHLLEDYSGTWKLQPSHIKLVYLQPSKNYDSDLECRLVDHHGFDPNQFTIRGLHYAALSYTWGDPVFDRTLYQLDGDKIMITENLDAALRKVRDRCSEQILWVDAICIDQGDLAERTFQVKTMHSVYYQATQVHAWLGSESELNDGQICFALFERIFERLANHQKQFHPANRDTSTCHEGQAAFDTCQADLKSVLTRFDRAHIDKMLQKFFERKYFSRRWIIQEITFSQNLILHCGSSTLKWTLDSDCTKSLFLDTIQLFVDDNAIKILRATLLCKGQKLVHMKNPVDVMLNADRFDCFDDRDRVIALLHVLRLLRVTGEKKFDHLLKRIGYFSSVEEVYVIFAQFSMLYGALQTVDNQFADLEIDGISHLLQVACSTRSPPLSDSQGNASNSSLPSWVPDWRQSGRYAIPRPDLGSFTALDISCQLTNNPEHIAWGCSQSTYQRRDGFSSDEFLHAFGIFFDAIKEIKLFSEAEILDDSYYTQALELYLQFPGQNIHDHLSGNLCKNYYSPTGETFREALATTLIANYEHCIQDLTRHAKKDCDISIDEESLHENSTMSTRPLADEEESPDAAYSKLLTQTMRGRCFFTTRKGYIGIGPDDTQPKDIVCIFGGLRLPFIIRTENTGVLKKCCQRVWAPDTNEVAGDEVVTTGVSADVRLVGDTYIHGVMDGRVVGEEWRRCPGAFQPMYIV
jgi:hypothetical protein